MLQRTVPSRSAGREDNGQLGRPDFNGLCGVIHIRIQSHGLGIASLN